MSTSVEPQAPPPFEERTIETKHESLLPLMHAALTDTGVERSENQDAWGQVAAGPWLVLIVCDGMGGHAGGSTASRMAVEILQHQLGTASVGNAAALRAAMTAAAVEANAQIHALAAMDRDLRGMGTTLVMAGVHRHSGEVCIGHVGDSRAYLLRGDLLRRLTRDHTMVQRLVDDGVLTPEAAERHPHSNIISRSLGGNEEVELELLEEPLRLLDGDLLLLCSDGLSGMISEAQIASLLADDEPPGSVATLIEAANAAGGLDNITVAALLVGARRPAHPVYRIQHPSAPPGSRLHRAAEADAASTADTGAMASTRAPAREAEPRGSEGGGLPAPGTRVAEMGEPPPGSATPVRQGPLLVVAALMLAVIVVLMLILVR